MRRIISLTASFDGYERWRWMWSDHDALQNPDVERVARLPDEVAAPLLDLAAEHLAPVLRDKDQMDLEGEDAVAAAALLHGAKLAVQAEGLALKRAASTGVLGQ